MSQPLVFMTEIVEYTRDGEFLMDGIVYLKGWEVFQTSLSDRYDPEGELAVKFAATMQSALHTFSKEEP